LLEVRIMVAPVPLADPLRVNANVAVPPLLTVPGLIVKPMSVGRVVEGTHAAGIVADAILELSVPPAERWACTKY
jgi:hypothetical protein